jgi:hypothetical protein
MSYIVTSILVTPPENVRVKKLCPDTFYLYYVVFHNMLSQFLNSSSKSRSEAPKFAFFVEKNYAWLRPQGPILRAPCIVNRHLSKRLVVVGPVQTKLNQN